ncbi:cobalt-precorrin-5B (C1)-methyltransferase [Bathymodiolus japonicus methanotrophic gill symbiont]|uniref:cobalt-precorrin-5B (C(1))-methyltransferase n=1 Tax=Bathymodiolus japonicus methanotrophic gill symbiont TaxID=113269 RepID=UPI001B76240F|nr:cobalt-precorrin-5B (C(1))-methyltransferase [Bathymodiolus japonicus methanotrophic gill symbiont]GFO71368.1 cobalt-precorrin-5B (C1)-methyltransferase [Bathymodiolus japonicus methanotrophic gill symbiont]
MTPKKPKGTRKGFTTGACSAAAARAATLGLLTGKVPEKIESLLPNGQRVSFAVHASSVAKDHAQAVIIKDAGDDPDCTHKAHMTVAVCILSDTANQVLLKGGDGVGTITMRGLGLEVGGPAINPVPRKNIEANIREVASDMLQTKSLEVTISVPGGRDMAKKTLNDRLGIIDGISILGTNGIVHPYSTAAFRASVVQGVEVAANQGQQAVVLTTGGRTEKFTIRELADLDPACFVQMGDFLGPALDSAQQAGIKQIIIGGMVGKVSKIAQGEVITHARRNPVNTQLLADLAAEVGAEVSVCEEIAAGETARFAGERMHEQGLADAFYKALCARVVTTLEARYPGVFSYRILMCDFDGEKLVDYGV